MDNVPFCPVPGSACFAEFDLNSDATTDVSASTTLTVYPIGNGQLVRKLLLTTSGSGLGELTGGGSYPDGSTATVFAAAYAGSIFTGWFGPNAGDCASGSFAMGVDEACTGAFIPTQTSNPVPAGDNVAVSTESGVKVTFSSITGAGDINVSATPGSSLTVSSGFRLGNPSVIYDISPTASYSGSAQLCLPYLPSQSGDQNALHLYHYDNGNWVDVTTYTDTTNFEVCGEVTSFSPFVVVESIPVPGDLNGDGVVDVNDYNLFIATFGKCVGQTGYNPKADYDGDGCITFVDYQKWYGYYLNQ